MNDAPWLAPGFTPRERWHLARVRAWVRACWARGAHHEDTPEIRRLLWWRWAYRQGLIGEWPLD